MKGLENQAIRVSTEARGESTMAGNMLKDIVSMEQSIPSSLKVPTSSVSETDLIADITLSDLLIPLCSPMMLRKTWAAWFPGWTV